MTTNKSLVRLILAVGFSAILILVVGLSCKSNEPEIVADLLDSSESEGSVQVLEPNGSFTVDDVVAAGWKKSKELSAETLPDAMSVWYGFYNQRDVEVRIYESHETAKNSGAGPADESTGRGKERDSFLLA